MDVNLSKAVERSEWVDHQLSRLIQNLELIATDRHRLAGGAFMVALDVHSAIAALTRRNNLPSAFMLSRSIWEAIVRGFWLLECASDEQIKKFIDDTSNQKTWNMIQDLEAKGSFDSDTLSSIHAHNSRRLNAMNHVGGPLLVRCNSERGIEFNFDSDEIGECLGNACANALLAALGLAQAAADEELGKAVFKVQTDAFAN
ncbi:hypothetical protein A0J57_11170 [Sphingobium sp. 22B]|uniref:DUF6988 family protein n=1 Tax=unclassified Sphingobium TaxID=2611147 RepID=UPI000782E2B7|nr:MULTISPECIES: hypothetical protein [unclassified Sphingobium]KXU32322.1 hypothetical protein AXW74_07760 [Sphingobium sp. AM]KYC32215.1 hypothetical protein A0J57_11170 [Sphingobium sp. 22B]OAP31846.1 hypothetical protein A8O16_10965 [Sphingobium sp. 20006FA]UZW54905.1 hypothetical protein NUH86_15730 [Sphingobium sp. JS3065]